MKPVLVEISARHVHVSREDLDILFGKGYELTPKKDLSSPVSSLAKSALLLLAPRKSFPAFPFSVPAARQLRLSFL